MNLTEMEEISGTGRKKKKVLEYIFHSQIQAVQLHKTEPRCARAATSSRQASPQLRALFDPAKATPKRGHPIPPTRPGPNGSKLARSEPSWWVLPKFTYGNCVTAFTASG